MSGYIPLSLTGSEADKRSTLRSCIEYLKRMKQSDAVYGICKQSSMPSLHTDLIEQLLHPTENCRDPFLSINDNFAYRLKLVPHDGVRDKTCNQGNFLLHYTELFHNTPTQTSEIPKRRRK